MCMIRYAGLHSSRGPSQHQGSRDVPWCAAKTSKLHDDANESRWTQEVREYVLDEEKTELSNQTTYDSRKARLFTSIIVYLPVMIRLLPQNLGHREKTHWGLASGAYRSPAPSLPSDGLPTSQIVVRTTQPPRR